uniref:Uncharacterized protein n=1 Tax=Panagrolaimus sp. JU765 TaxID=591449 RepID=A0AC34QNZ6_9BILA
MSFLFQYLSEDNKGCIGEQMKILLEELEDSASSSTLNGSDSNDQTLTPTESEQSQPRRSPRKSKPVQSYSPIRGLQKTPNKPKILNGKAKKRVIVPATPDDVEIKKSKSEPILTKEVVAETPADQCRKRLKDKDSKTLVQLWTQAEEEKDKKKRASRRLSFMPLNCSQNGDSLNGSIRMSNGFSQCSDILPSLRRFSSSKSLSSISVVSASSSTAAISKNSPGKSSLNAAKCLTDEILQRYRRRMEDVRSQSKKADSSDIFYGRSAGRLNLFSEEETLKQQEERRITRSQASQKNRSGRNVVQDSGAVYIAHTLLNTHNKTPLMPFKPPKDGQFRIRKLVKHATRANWKKLQKFIQKSQTETVRSAS